MSEERKQPEWVTDEGFLQGLMQAAQRQPKLVYTWMRMTEWIVNRGEYAEFSLFTGYDNDTVLQAFRALDFITDEVDENGEREKWDS